MNKCHFIGNLARDPHEVDTPSGVCLVIFTLALESREHRRPNEGEEPPTFIDCEAWDTGAERILRDFRKGDPIVVHCQVKTHKGQLRFRVREFDFPPRNPPKCREA